MAKIDKPLKYDANQIIGVHQLKYKIDSAYFDKIVENFNILVQTEILFLEDIRKQLDFYGNYWDNNALNMNFLTHLIRLAKLRENEKIDVFYERTLSWEYEGRTERVVCDCLLAKPFGIYAPQVPYFFLQEFKKQKQNEDAEGQMLLAMLIAQQNNNNEKPVYGCYLQGKNWVFTTLHEKNYCVSRQYDATQTADLHQIVYILRALKEVILTELS